MNNSIKKIFYSTTYFISIFILLFIISAIIVIILKININHIDIFYSLWIHNTEANMYIIYILNGYIKDRNTGPSDYVAAGEKSIKIDLYGTSIITIDILNGPDTIIFTNTAYYPTFLINVISAKCFQFKKIYLDKKHN